jgi:hypothetical protein
MQIFNTHFSFEFMCFFFVFFILEVIFFSSRTNIKKKYIIQIWFIYIQNINDNILFEKL